MKSRNLLSLAVSTLLVLHIAFTAPAHSQEPVPSPAPVGGRTGGGARVVMPSNPSGNSALETNGITIRRSKPDTPYSITLDSNSIRFYGGGQSSPSPFSREFTVARDSKDKEALLAIFVKAAEWQDKALEIKAEPFKKEIPGLTFLGAKANFIWRVYNFDTQTTYEAVLAIPREGSGRSVSSEISYDTLNMKDVRIFAELTKEIPGMEKEYNERMERVKKQDELFK